MTMPTDKHDMRSLAEVFRALPLQERVQLLEGMTDDECTQLQYDWRFWARLNQVEPITPGWIIWMVMAGRGWGKNRGSSRRVSHDQCEPKQQELYAQWSPDSFIRPHVF